MGTITYHKAPGVPAVDSIKEHAFGAEWLAEHFVAATATREAVFVVVKAHEPDSAVYVPDADGTVRVLLVFKLSLGRGYYNFGYKDMTETMGPCGCEAPLSILAKCSELRPVTGDLPDNGLGWATAYRGRCKALAAAKAFKRGLKPGDVVTLPEPMNFGGTPLTRFTVERARVRGRKGISTVFRADSGMLC